MPEEPTCRFRAVILMGVSGSGKTTIGQMLAAQLGWDYVEGDEYHPPENIRKMANGTPLSDADRQNAHRGISSYSYLTVLVWKFMQDLI